MPHFVVYIKNCLKSFKAIYYFQSRKPRHKENHRIIWQVKGIAMEKKNKNANLQIVRR